MGGEAARRVHFGRNNKFPFGQFLSQPGMFFTVGDFQRLNCFIGMQHLHTAARGIGKQRFVHGGDMLRGGTTTATDDTGSGFTEGQGIIAEVIRVGRVHNPPANLFGPTGIGLDPNLGRWNNCVHSLEQAQQLRRATRAVNANHICSGLRHSMGHLFRRVTQDGAVVACKRGRCNDR